MVNLLPEFCIIIASANRPEIPSGIAKQIPAPKKHPVSRALWHVVLRFCCSLRSFGKDVKNIKINAPDSVRLRRATLSGELGSETKNSIALETTGALESALITASRSGL